MTILGAAACFAVGAMLFIYHVKIDGNARLLPWFEELLVYTLLYFAFLGSTWFDYLTAPYRRDRVFGRESRFWPRDGGALCAALVETEDLRLLPQLLDKALSGGRRPGLGGLELPIRGLFDRMEPGDRNLLDLDLRRRLYRRLDGSSSSRLLELKIAVLRAAERVGDHEAIKYARRLIGNNWIAAHQPRLHEAAATYLAAIDRARGQTGAHRPVELSKNGEPGPSAIHTFKESTRLSRPYLVLFQVTILILLIAASWYFAAARRERMIWARATSAAPVGHRAVNSLPAPVR